MIGRLWDWFTGNTAEPPTAPVNIETCSDGEAAAYLRHPTWTVRCACKRYGNPYLDADLVVVDNDGTHEKARCQPLRERIP